MHYMKLTDSGRTELLHELAAMPEYLRQKFASLSGDMAVAPGPDGAFCPLEQVWHLADLEVEGFGHRIDRLLSEANPNLPDFDGAAVARERNYRSLSLVEGLERFESARRVNLQKLRSVPENAWANSGIQAGVGAVSLCDMPAFLQQHDRAHKAEIKEWCQYIADGAV